MLIRILVAVFLVLGPALAIGEHRIGTLGDVTQQKGAHLIQLLNAAELQYRENHDSFATIKELRASGVLQRAINAPGTWSGLKLDLGNLEYPLANYRLTVLVSGDRNSYSVALINHSGQDCATSLFSNESALIWHGRNIQCPIDSTPTAYPNTPAAPAPSEKGP